MMLDWIFAFIWFVWFLSEILLNRLKHSGQQDLAEQDRGSIRIIWLAITLAIALAVYAAAAMRQYGFHSGIWLPVTGIILILLGMVIRGMAVYTLGKYFTVDLTIRSEHHLVDKGLYKLLRHPAYSGSLLSFIGFGFSLDNWLCVIIVVLLVPPAFLYRIHLEEKLLLKQFGDAYIDYMKKTRRLIPGIY